MNANELACKLETAKSISEIARLVKEDVIPMLKTNMNFNDLIYQLDQRYGNPYAKECALIQEAIEVLKLQSDEIKSLYAQLEDKNG